MHDFLELIFNLLQKGGLLAVLAAAAGAVCVLIAWLIFRRATKGERKFPCGRAVCAVLLTGYAVIVLYATILRLDGGYRDVSLHLFSGWREAWNGFSLQLWLNVLLNVALFVPLGVLLPLTAKCFRRWYVTLPVGFAVSLSIEAVQYITARGLFDIDDLFNNTLGAAIGYGLIMLCLTLIEKPAHRGRKCLAFAAVPAAFVLVVTGIFAGYHVKEFGNFRDAMTFTANTKNVTWETACELSDTAGEVPVYKTATFTKETCDAFGAAFAEKRGISFPDTYYYDGMTIFANHSTGDFLDVYYHDGSYEYNVGGVPPSLPYAEMDETTLRAQMAAYGITIPADAVCRYEGNGLHTFTASMSSVGDAIVDGTLSCWCREGDVLDRFTNNMLTFAYYRDFTVISPAEAYEDLCAGRFSDGDLFERHAPNAITVLSCTPEYRTDTKGFYRPVYVFELTDHAAFTVSVTVEAMK